MIVLVDSEGAIQRIVDSAEFEDLAGLTALDRDVPEGYPETVCWNAETLEFEPKPAPAPSRRLSLFQYLQLWTPEEATWFKNTTDPVAARAFILTLGSPVIDLDHPEVIAGIQYAEQAMPLGPGRAARIMAGLPPELDP
jgi:hypothetical protein